MEHLAAYISVIAACAVFYRYVSRKPQLYYLVPNFFRISSISENAYTILLVLINHGDLPEEDVTIEMDPNFEYSILASSTSQYDLDKSTLKLKKIPPYEETSLIVLIEGGDFSLKNISRVSSNRGTGSKVETRSKVPIPHKVKLFLTYAVILYVLLIVNSIHIYDSYQSYMTRHEFT